MKSKFNSIPLFSTVILMAIPTQSNGKKSDKKPNILFIITDQQFAEVISFKMGNKFINTPNMDRLVKEKLDNTVQPIQF